MTTIAPETETPVADGLVGAAPPSPAGPIDAATLATLAAPPSVEMHPLLQSMRFSQRQIEYVFWARRTYGEVVRMRGMVSGGPIITSHPDHVRSLFTAKPEQAPSLTKESPLRPIVGPNSVLTAVGPRHMRQRKLLLPPFHGEAIEAYSRAITEATEREIDRWPVGEPFALAPRMQAITLDVIMAGIFGIEGKPEAGTPEARLRAAVKGFVAASMRPLAVVGELMHIGREEPMGLLRLALSQLDKPTYEVIRARRKAELGERHDILSLLLQARTEEGEALDEKEIRDELLTLVLAGHETTANSLAWAWERLLRFPEAHEALVESVRAEEGAEDRVEATIVETMRSRPVIPMIGRRVAVPWQFGEFGAAADTPVGISILLLHHREDLYPDPYSFRPERWLGGRKPGTYEWIPFGGGIRRCLGAALAMAEQRVVLTAMARRLDLEAPDPAPEHAVHRNVTMIPARGATVVLRSRRA
ncbi:MAG TPA: cytochrome P450 [Solirubrobacterales bacterium]|jgi:cytochrome P450